MTSTEHTHRYRLGPGIATEGVCECGVKRTFTGGQDHEPKIAFGEAHPVMFKTMRDRTR